MTDGILKDLTIPPGFHKANTEYTDRARWIDGDKVRFKNGYLEKMGGWNQRAVTSTINGEPRAIHTWADLQGQRLLAVGTNLGLALWFSGADFLDITPLTFQSGLASNITGFGYGSGPYSGDYPPPAQVSAGTDVTSLLSVGVSISGVTSADLGWSESPASVSLNQPGSSELALLQWSLDNFGEDLIANPRGQDIYRWDRSSVETTVVASATIGINPRAVKIPNSPKSNLIVISEPSPYLVAFGTCTESGPFDPLLVRWCDQQNFSDWNASAQNTAGDFRIQGGSEIVGVQKTKRETLIFTDDVVYSMQLQGGTAVFAFERIAANSGLISQHAAIDVNSTIYWMGPSSFFLYNGILNPIETPLDETVFDRTRDTSLNFNQREKVYAGINSEFSEIWWLYPSRDSDVNDRYIIYNYLQNIWYDGTIDRTVWTDGDVFELPIGAFGSSASGVVLYDHELDYNDDGSPMNSWAKTGVFNIDNGDKLLFVNKIVPDFTNIEGTLNMTLVGKKYPQATSIIKGPYEFSQMTDKIDIRLRARQMQIKVSSCAADGNFELGTLRANIRPDGER